MVFEKSFGKTIIGLNNEGNTEFQTLTLTNADSKPLSGKQFNENDMNSRFVELLNFWRQDEQNYQDKESSGKFFADERYKHFNPGLREEALKLMKMENMLNDDYQKMREDMFMTNMGLLKRNKELIDQNGDIMSKSNPEDNEKMKGIEKDNLRHKMELNLLKDELEKAKAENKEWNTRFTNLQTEFAASKLRITQLENMAPPAPVSRIKSCFGLEIIRTQMLIKTHTTDLLALCKKFKQTIIDGIRNDFQSINSGNSDDYEKSMIIREHLNKKDHSIKRIDELIKIVTNLYEDSCLTSHSGSELEIKLAKWNQDYNIYTETYKDIVKEYERIFGKCIFSDDFEEEIKHNLYESEFISGAQDRLLDQSIIPRVTKQDMIEATATHMRYLDGLDNGYHE